jgi:hypothetical protein
MMKDDPTIKVVRGAAPRRISALVGTVLADTFALIAWLNPRDNAHAVGTAYLGGFTGRVLTTEG